LKRLREAEDGFVSVEDSNDKGEGMSNLIGIKLKQSGPDTSLSSGGEMEGAEGVVRSLEPKPSIDVHGYDKDTIGSVGVRFVKKMEPGLLSDPWSVSSWVEKMVGAIESVKVTLSGGVWCERSRLRWPGSL
jgi:hypothetical protein